MCVCVSLVVEVYMLHGRCGRSFDLQGGNKYVAVDTVKSKQLYLTLTVTHITQPLGVFETSAKQCF